MVKIRQDNIDIISVIRAMSGLVMLLLMLLASVANAERLLSLQEIQSLLEQKKISQNEMPNPHWHAEGCVSCHVGEASAANKNLRTNNINELCNDCHKTSESHSIIHPVGIPPDKKMLSRMPSEFLATIKQSSGKMDCLTCHDVVQACRADREQKRITNPKFFRGSNYQDDRTRLCFYCHDEGQYERLNPHKQIAKDGKLKEDTCYVCHEKIPDTDQITDIGQVYFNVEDNYSSVEDNYSLMCNGCHPWKPHPGSSFSFQKRKVVDHLVVPSDKVMRLLEGSQMYLPLQPGTRRVFCGTCHNVHEKGVIKRTAAAKGAGNKHFLRDQNLCVFCHSK